MMIDPDDLAAVMEKDPAVVDEDDAIRYHAGFHAVCLYREAHKLWEAGEFDKARELNFRSINLTGCDIHPAAKIGKRFFVDHAIGVVIGETAEIGEDVCIYQGVTLGGVSFNKGKRHPTVGNHVVIGCNASVLGNITIGDNVRIGAGSVVLSDVPDHCTVVGVPGRIVRRAGIKTSGSDLMHNDLPDPEEDQIQAMAREIEELKAQVRALAEALERKRFAPGRLSSLSARSGASSCPRPAPAPHRCRPWPPSRSTRSPSPRSGPPRVPPGTSCRP
ncbi:MAG: serine acetyltransferase [Thermoplasmata archaeon]|nr:serine acetyltransferase [Thermoplasmata archaeon]